MRNQHGDEVMAGSNWSGSFALDIRNEEVRAYVAEVLRTVTEEWGFRLLKLDFLYAACLELHDGLNRGELMADALASAFGRCEYCRIG